nr:Protein Y54G2A.20 [Haemonchus contortus]
MLKKNVYSHLKVVHRTVADEVFRIREEISREAGTATVICPLCEESFSTYDGLAQHCGATHADNGAGGRPQNYSIISEEFNNRQEYELWLTRRCEDTCTSLFKERVRTSGASSRLTLLCNRSGTYKKTGTQRASVSKKDVRYCSCHLNVTFNEGGTVAVKGCFGHVGHELDPALLKFSSQQRIYLKTLLEEHSMDYIISRLRKEDATKSTKLYFVVKQDLHNIIRKYRMAPGWRHDDDVTSLKLRYEENNPDDGIRYMELPRDPSGKVIITPLMLNWLMKYSSKGVSLDDTFHTTRYNLRLATLMVSDERDRGLPGAFLISGTMTSTDVERFHIAQTWERKTKEVVEASMRSMVIEALRKLLKERQLDKFQRRFAEILAYLREKSQNTMAEYLERNYLGRIPSWASFANKGAILDTTMISERFHLRIKEEFLHRNSNCRLDAFVELLINAVEDLSESIAVKDRRRFAAAAYRLQETNKNHRRAETIYAQAPDLVVSVARNKWLVRNTAKTEEFDVTYEGPCPCDESINTHCLSCGVCAYVWTCTCLETRSGISCLHRHAVRIHSPEGLPPTERAIPTVPTLEPLIDMSAAPAQERREARNHLFNAIKSTYAVVEANASSLTKLDTDEAMDHLKKILHHIQLAAEIGPPFPSSTLAVRPELAQIGGKPELSRIPLHQRRKVKKEREPIKDLHEEVRRLTETSSDEEQDS